MSQLYPNNTGKSVSLHNLQWSEIKSYLTSFLKEWAEKVVERDRHVEYERGNMRVRVYGLSCRVDVYRRAIADPNTWVQTGSSAGKEKRIVLGPRNSGFFIGSEHVRFT